MVGLAGKQNRFPHELSGGEQQRVAMARAVVNKPAILLADEPTGNLDPNTSAGIMTLLSAINANGTTVIMATHDVGIVDQMQRRVIELVSGQVVRDERGGGYQTSAMPVVQQPVVVQESVIEDEALAPMPVPTLAPAPAPTPAPTPAPAPAPVADAPVTGTITVVEPEVVRPATPPPSPRGAPHVVPRTDEPAPDLVPPPLNEPRRR
jgi:cell division transport system ATP-binding protein